MGLSHTLVVALALGLPATALAQMAPNQSGRAALVSFKSLDRDGDHGLTYGELRARGREKGSQALFALLDGDGDGRLSLKELGRSGEALGRFQAYDVNKDGFVARNEFPNFVDPLLVNALDRDGDRRLDLGEMRPAFAGNRAVPVGQDQAAPRKSKAKAKAGAYCWIPGFGDDKWMMEAPVLWTRCRTS